MHSSVASLFHNITGKPIHSESLPGVSFLNRIFTRIGLYFGKVWCQYQEGSIRVLILILSLLFVHLVLNVKILAYYTYSELTIVVLPHTNGVYSIYSPYCLADHNSASAIQNAVGATECYGRSKGLTLRQIGLFSWCQVTTGTTFCLCYK
jgi:hypothetical protein